MRTVAMKESGMPLGQRFQEFPWMLSDLIFPFMMEYLVSLFEWPKKSGSFGELTSIGTARLVSYLGDDPEYFGRVDILCRQKFLRCLVEQR